MTKAHILRNLSDLDVDNLHCRRITVDVLKEAFDRCGQKKFSHHEMIAIAEELNDILKATEVHHEER